MHGCTITQPYHNGLAKIAGAMRRVCIDSHRPLAGRHSSTSRLGRIQSPLPDGGHCGGNSPAPIIEIMNSKALSPAVLADAQPACLLPCYVLRPILSAMLCPSYHRHPAFRRKFCLATDPRLPSKTYPMFQAQVGSKSTWLSCTLTPTDCCSRYCGWSPLFPLEPWLGCFSQSTNR
jgi:hypothetical protein